jgi:hypothetical protein
MIPRPNVTAARVSVIGGFAIALVFSDAVLHLVREKLHVGCGYFAMGSSRGDFTCADGIGYLGPLFVIYVSFAGIAAVALATLLLQQRNTVATGSARLILVILAMATPAAFLLLTFLASLNRSPDDAPATNYWPGAMLPVTAALGCSVVCAGLSLVRRPRPLTLVAVICAVLSLVFASVIEPGTISSNIMELALLANVVLVSGATGPRPRMKR